MFEEKWTPKKTHKGKKWNGPPQFENPEGDLMMLSTDLALVNDPKFRVWAEKYYKDEELWFKDFAKYYNNLMNWDAKTSILKFHGIKSGKFVLHATVKLECG